MLGVDAKESFEPVFAETDRSLPGLLIGVQLCARSRDFEPLKRDVSVIITHAPFTTLVENSRGVFFFLFFFFFFFFFFLATNLPSFKLIFHGTTAHGYVFGTISMVWWTQFNRQTLLKNAFYSPEIVSGHLSLIAVQFH